MRRILSVMLICSVCVAWLQAQTGTPQTAPSPRAQSETHK